MWWDWAADSSLFARFRCVSARDTPEEALDTLAALLTLVDELLGCICG